MNTNHHDRRGEEFDEARLTAYALGQLDKKDGAAVEAELAASPEARRLVEETAALGRHLLQAHRRGPSPQASPALREALARRLDELDSAHPPAASTKPSAGRSRRGWRTWTAVAVAVCLLVAAIPLYFATVGAKRPNGRRVAALRTARETGLLAAGNNRPGPTSERLVQEIAVAERGGRQVEIAADGAGLGGSLPGEADMMELHDGSIGVTAPSWLSSVDLSGASGVPPVYTLDAPGQPGRPSDGVAPKGERLMQLRELGPGIEGSQQYVMTGGNKLNAAIEEYAEVRRLKEQAAAGRSKLQEIVTISSQGASDPVYRRLHEEVARTEATLDLVRAQLRRQIRTELPQHLASEEEAPGTEQYDVIVENDFVEAVGQAAVSTFSADVDTASYANVRRFINQDRLPPPGAVRIEEMINYFQYGYPLPEGDAPFSVNMEVAECPWNGEHRLLRIGLKGREIEHHQRGPGNLVFLLDVSGSMRDENKLPLVKRAMGLLAKQLREDDRVGIVTYADEATLRLESTLGDDHQTILAAIESLRAGGSTHGSAGIQLAYQQALSHFVPDGTNRVILCTDGDLNVGVTDDDELVQLIREQAKSGALLTVLGFGTGNLKDSKLEKLADNGNGTYAYIDDLSEAYKVLVEQLTGSLLTIAKDVKLQIEFNPARVYSYRLIGYENRLLAAEDFCDDTKDAGEIGAGHTVTVLYEIMPGNGKHVTGTEGQGLKYQHLWQSALTGEAHSGELASLKLRYKPPGEDESRSSEFVVSDAGRRFGEASVDFRFASAVAAFGMVLRDSRHRGDATPAAVEEIASNAVGDDPQGHRSEFVELVRHARRLLPQ